MAKGTNDKPDLHSSIWQEHSGVPSKLIVLFNEKDFLDVIAIL